MDSNNVDLDKIDRINKSFGALIIDADPTFYELAESIAKLTVGLFLKTNFDGCRTYAFESYVQQVRERLGEELEAGKALEDEPYA